MIYNVKCLHYANGDTETRIYSHSIRTGITKKAKRGKKQKGESTAQTEEQRERSTMVSMNRTKNQIFSIARSNKWDYFVTLTFSPKEVDRMDYSACTKKLSKWLNNLRRLAPDMVYLFVPEQHRDGAWHFHGLFADVPQLTFVDSGCTTKDGQTIYNILNYSLGFTTATKVRVTDAVSRYITKYITKDMCVMTKNRKRYWVSRNAQRPIEQYFDMDSWEISALHQELREDCTHESYVQCTHINRSTRYFQNEHLTLCHEPVDETTPI